MCIIVCFQFNMWAWLHKASLPSHPKALLTLLDTNQSESWLGAASDENWRPPAPENIDAKP